MYVEIEQFCQLNPGMQEVISSLGNDISMKVHMLPYGIFMFYKKKDNIKITPFKRETKFDIEAYIPQILFKELLHKRPQTGKEVVLFIAEHYFSHQKHENISFKIHIGFIKFSIKGYLNILKIGGPALFEYLKKHELGSFTAIKNALKGLINK